MKNDGVSKKQLPQPQSKGGCVCPYCDEQVMVLMAPFCQSCGVALSYCTHCQIALDSSAAKCPTCGGPVEKRTRKAQ
jgi:hypothetical protein